MEEIELLVEPLTLIATRMYWICVWLFCIFIVNCFRD
jgi:hypothetical protein